MATTKCIERFIPEHVDNLLKCSKPYLCGLIWTGNEELGDENIKTQFKSKEDYLTQLIAYLTKIKNNNYINNVDYFEGPCGGRQFSRGFSIQKLKKNIRGYIVNATDYDIDNCHPTLLKTIAERDCDGIDTSVLNYYISNRDAVLSQHNLTKMDIIVTMNKDTYRGKNEWLKKFHKEVKLIQNHLSRNTNITTTATTNKNASILNKILCAEENTLLKKCINEVKLTNPSICIRALMFDGFMSNNPNLIDKLNEISTDWGVNWSIKPGSPLLFVEPSEQDHDETSYEFIKEEFELTHGFVKRPQPVFYSKYVKKDTVDLLDRYSSMELSTTYHNKYFEETVWDAKSKEYIVKQVKFMGVWAADPTRLTFERFDFLPPPYVVPDDTYNLFNGFLYEKYDVEPDNDYSDILELYRHLAGSEKTDEIVEYMLNYHAHLIQYPGNLPRTSVIFKSDEGLGKNVLFEGFGRNVLGNEYVLCAQRQEDIVGRFSVTNNKFIVIWNEASGKDTHSAIDAIKTLITEETVSWEAKGKQTVAVHNVARLFFFTNNECPIKISPSDRRFMVVECDAERSDYSKDLCDRVRASWDNKAKVVGFANFLKNRDISNWDACRDRVITEFYESLASRSVPHFEQFIINRLEDRGVEDGEERIGATIFYCEYKKWCEKKEYRPQTQCGFGVKIKKIEGITKIISARVTYVFDSTKVLEYMKDHKYVPQEQYLDIINGEVELED